MKYLGSIIIVMALVLIAGCQSQATPEPTAQPTAVDTLAGGYPAPGQVTPSNGYPAPTIESKVITAFQAYQIGLPYAQKWNGKAVLYAIPATYQQETNFGHPQNTEGWFMEFKDSSSPLEYYIYITEGKFGGAIEAQQIVVDKTPPPYEYQPLPELSKMLDSDKFTDLYMKNGGDNYLATHPKAAFNPQLTFLKGDSYPIWRMFDGEDVKNTTTLFAVNALTGEIVNPQ